MRGKRVGGLLCIVALVSACGSSGGDDSADRIAELEQEVADLRGQLAEAEGEASTTEAVNTTEPVTTTTRPPPECRGQELRTNEDGIREQCRSGQWELFPVPTTTARPSTTLAPTTSSTTIPTVPWTTAELDALLAGPLQAWASNPSSDSYVPVRETAEAIAADASRDLGTMLLPDFANPEYGTGADAIANLIGESGDLFSIREIRIATGHIGLPDYTPVAFPSGVYRVGTEPGMVPPGTYVAESVNGFDNCYWETLDSTGDIIDNNFLGSGFRVVANVPSGALSVEFDGCGWFFLQ